MKTLRVMFLVLLALLLPIRGAVAGAMLCPEGSPAPMHVPGPDHPEHGMREAHAGAAHHHHEHAGPAHHHEASGSAGHAGSCSVCATFCSMTPLLSAIPTLAQSAIAAAVTFPALSAPTPTFQSDGQDRPPRSI